MRTILIYFLLICPVVSVGQKQQYKIAYNVYEDTAKDNYDIYIMNMDGSGQKNITNTPGVEWVYYAYEDRIFFISDRDTCHRCYFLYEMDAEGNNIKKLGNLQLEDSWMSSRNKATEMIVLGRIGKLRDQLFLINLKDGSYKQLTNDTVSTKRDPLFLSGGNEIVLAYRPDRSLRRTVPDELWKMNLDMSNKIQLTYFPKEDTTTEWFRYHAGPPQWNSKYKFISYLSRQKKQNQIYAVTPDGKKQWQIRSGDLSSGWHSWSPDGKWLVMDKSTHDEKGYDIYLMNFKTKKTIQLTSDPKYEQAPVIVEVKR
ncbi:MAG: TolB family protein [Bacteroidota bacterium]